MRFSISMVATGRPSWGIAEIARAVEERGLDGLWLPDHTHVPVSRATPYPVGGDLPDRYRRNLEPITALALAATATTRIRLGTGILLAAQRDPIVTAKALATLDDQSGGRLAVGVGYGWNLEEMRDHGVEPTTRRARLREHVLAMRALWQDDIAGFDGEHVAFEPSWSWPKPRPDLPVLLGGAASARTFAAVAEFGQGWIPMGSRGLADAVSQLRGTVAAAGRNPAALEVIPFLGALPDPDRVAALRRAGATELAVEVQPGDAPSVRAALDRVATVAETSKQLC